MKYCIRIHLSDKSLELYLRIMRNLLIILIMIKGSFAVAQNGGKNEIDSLKNIIPSLNNNSLCAVYNQLGNLYIHNNTDSALYYLSLSVQLSDEIEDLTLVVKSYQELSFIYREQGKYDSALFYSNNALSIVKKQNDPLNEAKLFYSIALLFKAQGQYDTAHVLLKQNLATLKRIENETGLAVTYNALGQLAEHVSNYPLALDYYYNAISIYDKLGSKSGVAIVRNNIGIVNEKREEYHEALKNYNIYYQYNKEVEDKYRMAIGLKNAGIVLEKIGELDSAIWNFETALKYDSLFQSSESISYSLLGLGSVYLAKEDPESAYQNYSSALKLAQDPLVIAGALIGMGTIHMLFDSSDSAVHSFESAIKVAEEVGLENEKKEAHFLLYKVYSDLNDIEKAFANFQNYVLIKDSLFNEENINKIAGIRARFEFESERREQKIIRDIEISRAKSIRNIFIIGTLFITVIAFLLFIIYRRKKIANIELNSLYETVKRQSLELQELDQAKSQFFTNISHELRTPLTLINSPLEYLIGNSNTDLNNSEAKHYLNIMSKNTHRLKVLVDDILDLTKLEKSKLPINKVPTNISSFMRRIFSNFESLAQHQNIKYELFFNSIDDENVLVDKKKIEKILNNLLSNAFKYTSSGGEIKLTLSRINEIISCEVRDNGQGIEAEHLPYIFDRFYQSNLSDSALQGGSGIGLALARELAKVIEGEIKVTSELGVGSVFTLNIPYHLTSESEQLQELDYHSYSLKESKSFPTPVDSNKKEVGPKKPTILVVEDHPEMQEFVGNLLKFMGNIILANNGKKALSILSEKDVDLIISDVMMPELNGHDLLESVRRTDTISSIPFIMLTALRSEQHQLKALSLGVDDYLVKPFSPNELIARSKNMISRRGFRKEFIENEIENNTFKVDQESQIKHKYKFKIDSKDLEFVEQMEDVLLTNLEDEDFSLKELAEVFCISYRQVERNTKKITGLSPKQFQKEVALQHARKLLEDGKYGNSTAIAYSVGIRHVTRFSNLYEERFGKRPEAYF